MKNHMIPGKKVEDVSGLYYELIKNQFDVENIGVDKRGVHVYLSDWEMKDPGPIVDSWVGKVASAPTKSLVAERRQINSEYQTKKSQREAEARLKAAEAGEPVASIPAPASNPAVLPMGSKETLFSKIFRKLW